MPNLLMTQHCFLRSQRRIPLKLLVGLIIYVWPQVTRFLLIDILFLDSLTLLLDG